MRHIADVFGEEGIPVHFFFRQGHGTGGYELGFMLGEGIGVDGKDARDGGVAVADNHFFSVADVLEVGAELVFQFADVYGSHSVRIR